MKTTYKHALMILTMLSALAFTACDDNNLEDAADSLGDAVENAADNVEDATN